MLFCILLFFRLTLDNGILSIDLRHHLLKLMSHVSHDHYVEIAISLSLAGYSLHAIFQERQERNLTQTQTHTLERGVIQGLYRIYHDGKRDYCHLLTI